MRYSIPLHSMGLAFVLVVASSGSFVEAASRTWTDVTGKFTIEAEMVEAGDDYVILKKADGSTKKVELAKLCEADRKFAADQQAAMSTKETVKEASAGSRASDDSANDKVATRKVATEFFDMLRKEDRAPLSAILSQAAQAKISDGSSPVLTLPKPDSKTTTRIGKATIDGDEATVSVKFRYEGTNQECQLSLRREADAWKIWSLTFRNGDAETVTNLESGESSASDSTAVAEGSDRDLPTGPKPLALGDGESVGLVQAEGETEMKGEAKAEGDLAAVDESNPQELLKKIEALRNDPQIKQDLAVRKQSLVSISDAAEKIFALENATKAQRTAAAKHQFEALQALIGSGVPDLPARAERFATQAKELGLKELIRPTEGLTLQIKIATTSSPQEFTAAIAMVEEFLAGGSIGPQEAMLANSAAQAAEQMQRRGMPADEVATAIETLAGPLTSSRVPQIASLGEQLLGKARRLGLVGKPMEIHGVTWDGKPLDMSQFDGKVVLVDFWATWCGPCIAEMPNIRANYDKYHDQGFDVIAISIDTKLDALNQYVQTEQVPWTVVADRHAKTPASKQMATYYGVNAIPCTILIGRDGNVVSLSARGKQLEQQLEKLLGSGG